MYKQFNVHHNKTTKIHVYMYDKYDKYVIVYAFHAYE